MASDGGDCLWHSDGDTTPCPRQGLWHHTQDCLPQKIRALRKPNSMGEALHPTGKPHGLCLGHLTAQTIPTRWGRPHLAGKGQTGTQSKERGFEDPGCTPCLHHRSEEQQQLLGVERNFFKQVPSQGNAWRCSTARSAERQAALGWLCPSTSCWCSHHSPPPSSQGTMAYSLPNVIGEALQGHIVQGQMAQAPKLREALWKPASTSEQTTINAMQKASPQLLP